MVRPTVKRPAGEVGDGAMEELGVAKKKKKKSRENTACLGESGILMPQHTRLRKRKHSGVT